MDKKQLGMILDLIDITYPGKLKTDNPQVLFETWYSILQEYEYDNVVNNLKYHIKASPFLPSLHDLVTDKTKKVAEGRYIPDAQTTYLELQQKEHEKRLALTTSAPKASKAEILAAKEKALREIASAVKRSEEENPYKVVD